MNFTPDELDLIEFGKFIIYKSLHEMQQDGDDLNTIQFDYLLDKTVRNFNDYEAFEAVINDSHKGEVKDWRSDYI